METAKFDYSTLTIGEAEDIEEITGQPLGTVIRSFETENWTATALKAIAVIIQRRKNPGFTVEQARDMQITVLGAEMGQPKSNGKKG